MRIALVVPGFSADESDWCIPALLDLVRLLARDHSVDVVSLRYPAPARAYAVYGARVVAVGGGQVSGLGRLLMFARALRALGRLGKVDVVHGLWAHEPGFLATLAARRRGVPSVVSLLGGELTALPDIGYGGQLTAANRWLVSRALRSADRVTVGSELLRRQAAEIVGGARLALAPLGVATERFGPDGPVRELAGEFSLLQVASLGPVKDHVLSLRALACVADELPQLHLHLVGEGDPAALEREARDLGIESRVTFHGSVPHHELPAWYRGADLCLLSSRFESQAMVALEAAACGRATVGTAVGVLPELVPPDLLAPVGDAPALADILRRLVSAPGEVERLGRECRSRVERELTLERTVANWVALYAASLG